MHANAQIFTKRLKKGVWDLKAIVDSGGMPSSHSALCTVRMHSNLHCEGRHMLAIGVQKRCFDACACWGPCLVPAARDHTHAQLCPTQ